MTSLPNFKNNKPTDLSIISSSKYLIDLFNEGEKDNGGDIEVKLNDDKIIYIHSIIVKRYEYFESMLHFSKDNNKIILDFSKQEIDNDKMIKVLKCIYGFSIEYIKEDCKELDNYIEYAKFFDYLRATDLVLSLNNYLFNNKKIITLGLDELINHDNSLTNEIKQFLMDKIMDDLTNTTVSKEFFLENNYRLSPHILNFDIITEVKKIVFKINEYLPTDNGYNLSYDISSRFKEIKEYSKNFISNFFLIVQTLSKLKGKTFSASNYSSLPKLASEIKNEIDSCKYIL